MSITYEWDVEVVVTVEDDDLAVGDITDHLFADSYRYAKQLAACDAGEGFKHAIVLVRDDDYRSTRSWAYLENGKLPTHFSDAWGRPLGKVPARFHDEVSKA